MQSSTELPIFKGAGKETVNFFMEVSSRAIKGASVSTEPIWRWLKDALLIKCEYVRENADV